MTGRVDVTSCYLYRVEIVSGSSFSAYSRDIAEQYTMYGRENENNNRFEFDLVVYKKFWQFIGDPARFPSLKCGSRKLAILHHTST